MTTRSKTIIVRVTEDGHDAVKHYADQEQRSLSDMARILLAEAIATRVKYGER